jgi:hypothetical protein
MFANDDKQHKLATNAHQKTRTETPKPTTPKAQSATISITEQENIAEQRRRNLWQIRKHASKRTKQREHAVAICGGKQAHSLRIFHSKQECHFVKG